MIRSIRLTRNAVESLARKNKPAVTKKIKEYQSKLDLFEANLTLETAGKYKDLFKKYGVKLGHFRVGQDRILGILKDDIFYVRTVIPRGKLDSELDRIADQFPFELE